MNFNRCNLIYLVLIVILGIALYIFYFINNKDSEKNKDKIQSKNKKENFIDDFKTCTQKESTMLKHTCLENNFKADYSLIRPRDYVDTSKAVGCQRYNSRYDFSTPSKMYIKLQ